MLDLTTAISITLPTITLNDGEFSCLGDNSYLVIKRRENSNPRAAYSGGHMSLKALYKELSKICSIKGKVRIVSRAKV